MESLSRSWLAFARSCMVIVSLPRSWKDHCKVLARLTRSLPWFFTRVPWLRKLNNVLPAYLIFGKKIIYEFIQTAYHNFRSIPKLPQSNSHTFSARICQISFPRFFQDYSCRYLGRSWKKMSDLARSCKKFVNLGSNLEENA